MADPQTANLQLFTPINGADLGTWDVPVNANWNQLEAVLTGVPSIALSNLPVTLSAGQYNSAFITFTGTLSANVTVTFPTFARTWTLFNNCLGNPNSFTVVCKTSASTIFVALPPGEPVQVFSDGTNIRYLGLGRVGTYMDIGSSTVPAWITQATPQPYLNCDGTTFSSGTYPALRDYLGTTTLPDSKGRFRAALTQGSTRLTGSSSLGGLDGTTLLAGGGNQNMAAANIPILSGGGLTVSYQQSTYDSGALLNQTGVIQLGGAQTGNVSGNVGGPGNAYAPPSYVGGLTLIRAG